MTKSTDAELADLDATALAAKIRARELSAIEVAEAAVRRMEALEPDLHAFCTPTPDIAHETARAIDIRLADGDYVGPLAGVPIAVKDLVAGPDPRDRRSIPCNDVDWTGFGPDVAADSLRGRRVAFSPDWGYAAVDPEIRRVVAEAVRVFETDLGCTVEEAHPGWDDPLGAFWALVAMESDLPGMRAMVAGRRHEVSPHLLDLLDRPWTAEDFTSAVMARKRVVNLMWRFMQRYDLLLTPTVATPAFPVDIQGTEKIDGRMVAPAQFLCFTFPMNMTGQPAISVPAGFTDAGLPVGLQIVGRHLADRDVLEAAMAFEAARPWADKRPALLARHGV